ncbi:hypothetical protein FKM82_017271 [Ascaphus truei]
MRTYNKIKLKPHVSCNRERSEDMVPPWLTPLPPFCARQLSRVQLTAAWSHAAAPATRFPGGLQSVASLPVRLLCLAVTRHQSSLPLGGAPLRVSPLRVYGFVRSMTPPPTSNI